MWVLTLTLNLLLLGTPGNAVPQSYGGTTGGVIDTPPPISCAAFIQDCVEAFNCGDDGFIITDGAGLLDLRAGFSKTCAFPSICCNIKGATPAPVTTCAAGLECVDVGQCKPDGTVNTDGEGLIGLRGKPPVSCYIVDSPNVGVCCQPPPLEYCPPGLICQDYCPFYEVDGVSAGLLPGVTAPPLPGLTCFVDQASYTTGTCCPEPPKIIEQCPGQSTCLPHTLCQGGQILDLADTFIPYDSTGTWATCRLGGVTEQLEGVCCITPVPLAAEKCGVRNVEFNPSGANSNAYTPELKKDETQFGEFPWQAILFFSNYTFKCGATLIDNRWLLTAAHCVYGYTYGDFKIRLGEWQVNTYDEPLPYVDIDIASITIDPRYNPKNQHYDLAIIELVNAVPYQYHINRVCLPGAADISATLGYRCFASGWGKDAFYGEFQTILKRVDVPIVEHQYCQELLRKTRLGKYFILNESFMCAGGEENIDACTGDGGGPLVCQHQGTGQYILQGLTAWGIDCGQKDVPGVYVDIPFFTEFINSVLYTGSLQPEILPGNAYGK